MNNTTTKHPEFGRVLPTLPGGPPVERKRNHWYLIAEECRRHPDQWVEVTIPALSINYHRKAQYKINDGRIAAFESLEYRACYRDRALWVMYSTTLKEQTR